MKIASGCNLRRIRGGLIKDEGCARSAKCLSARSATLRLRGSGDACVRKFVLARKGGFVLDRLEAWLSPSGRAANEAAVHPQVPRSVM